jgi:hypothetical protein
MVLSKEAEAMIGLGAEEEDEDDEEEEEKEEDAERMIASEEMDPVWPSRELSSSPVLTSQT